MRQVGFSLITLAAVYFLAISLRAETSLDALEKDLDEVKTQHKEASSQAIANFFDQLNTAAGSPDAALALYQQAGGALPDKTPIVNPDGNERQDVKAARLQQDQDNLTRLANMLQVHCALMRFAGLLATKPDDKGVNSDWMAWLKATPPIYAQLKGTDDLHSTADGDSAGGEGGNGGGGGGGWKKKKKPEAKEIGDWKSMTMRDSIISKYLNFHAWGDKDQAGWSVKELPNIYRQQVLEPLRAHPNADTLAAWDAFITMKNADEPDNDKWTQIEYPSLMFDRGCDDYAATPSMEKLGALLEIIKACPGHPKLDDMIARAHELAKDFRTHHTPGGAPAPTPTTSSDPNVTVTTQQQGDMTIITTHTNAPPVTPPAPQ